MRLLEALSHPAEAKILGPGIVREISYRVLPGEQGGGLRAAMLQGGHFGRIAKALRRIHAHFKAITATSPIQYIKAMRLHQARLLMIRHDSTAAAAATQVGYEQLAAQPRVQAHVRTQPAG